MTERPGVGDQLRRIFSVQMAICLTTGFASGLPLYVLIQGLPAWLETSGVDLKVIGLMALTSLPYTWKFLWAPLTDRYIPPFLGRRRGWLFVTQLCLAGALAGFAFVHPVDQIQIVTGLALAVAFFSATQDILLDAVRREILAESELGLGNALFVNAYRISSLVPGSLALILADRLPWRTVHLVVAAFVSVGLLTTLCMREPRVEPAEPTPVWTSFTAPMISFVRHHGARQTVAILAFMFLYKLGDSMATSMLTTFYLKIGFTMTQVGTVAKAATLWAGVGGGIVGGLMMLRIGINRALWLFGIVQITSILGLAALAIKGPDLGWLFAVVSLEFLGVGLGTVAFVAYIARSTELRYSATQLAWLTSLTGMPRVFANSGSGWIVESVGWAGFFGVCTVLAVPGMLMLPVVAPWNARNVPE